MRPEVEKGDIVNLAPYHFYMKVTGDEAEDAFSGQTVPLDIEESEKVRKAVIANSRKRYAMPKAKVEEYMEELFGADEAERSKKPKPRVTRRRAPKPTDTKDGEPKGLQGG